jgi:hypothetical protein
VLLKAAWCGDVRLRVAQFLANLWQGSCVVLYGTNTGAIVPAALDHKRLAPPVHCSPRIRWVESRADREASSVMTEGCAAVIEAKQIAVVAERNWSERCRTPVA